MPAVTALLNGAQKPIQVGLALKPNSYFLRIPPLIQSKLSLEILNLGKILTTYNRRE